MAERLTKAALMLAAAGSLLVAASAAVQGHVASTASVVQYVLIPLTLTVAALAALRLPLSVRVNLTIAGTSTVAGLYVAEAVTVLAWHAPGAPLGGRLARCEGMYEHMYRQCVFAIRHDLPFDMRRPLEVLHAAEEANPGAVVFGGLPLEGDVMYQSGDLQLAPLSRISNAIQVWCAETGVWQLAWTDEHGFRNPPDSEWSATDVVIVGDSFAEGYCVPDDSSIAGVLRTRGHQVLNLGRTGVGPLGELAILEEFGLAASPSLVVWMYYEGNDFDDLEREKTKAALFQYLDAGAYQHLIERQALVDSVLTAVAQRRRAEAERVDGVVRREEEPLHRSAIGFLTWRSTRRLVAQVLTRPPDPLFVTDAALFRRTLEAAQSVTRSVGGELVFVYLPEYGRYSGRRVRPDKTLVLETVRSLGIRALDGDLIFRESGDPMAGFPNRLDGHYGPEGYSWIAEALHELIEAGAQSAQAPAGQ